MLCGCSPLSRIYVEVLSKEIDILTPFGPILHFLGTFVLSKWDYSGQFNLSWELS